MLKRALLLQLMLMAVVCAGLGQPNTQTYIPLEPSGEIPKDMLIKSSKKYELEKSTISQSDSKKDRKSKESFYLSTNFEIDKLLLSGMVSFNDPVTVYLNKIVDVLLKDEPTLRKQVRVYTMKSTIMNAFATNQGIIFVNLGLLARVKNESELAFILAHEITHVEEKHALNKYLKVQTIKTGKNVYDDLSLDEKLANINHYSRELETEADEKGLQRYLKAGYSLDAVAGSFTALSYSLHPFVEHDVDFKWLESSTFHFPIEFVREKINVIKPLEDDPEELNDTTSTHPSIQKRRENVLSKIKDVNADGRKVFQVSEEDFKAARQFAQFEVCRLHMVRQMYHLAIYEALGLMKEYPENLYLQKVLLKSISALTYIEHTAGLDIPEWSDYVNKDLQGNIQRTHHFFLSLVAEENYLAPVAARYAWQLRTKYPQDKEIEAISDSMMHFVFYELQMDPEFFSKTPRPQTEADSIALVYKDPSAYRSKTWVDSGHRPAPSSRTATDSVVAEDSDTTHIKNITKTASLPSTWDSPRDLAPSDTTRKPEVTTTVEEEEDTVLYTTVAEVKQYKIKLTNYEKYQLKHKDRYDIKGVKKDGTIVYNTTEHDYTTTSDSRTDTDSDRPHTRMGNVRGDTTATDSTTIVAIDSTEKPYMHIFGKPLDDQFHKYAFVDFANDEAFYKKANQYHKQKEKDEDYVPSKTQLKKKERENDLNKKRGFALNIDKVVLVNPRYVKVNLANPDKQQYLTSEANQKKFSELLQANAKASGIKFQVIDNKNLKNKDVATFNDIAFLGEWLDERLELGKDVPFSTLELNEREALAKKYGTRYFMWTGNISVKEKDYYKVFWSVYSSIIPVLLPFTLPKIIRAGKYQIYYYLVYDIIENKMVLGDVVVSNQLERNDFLNSQVYYTFNQLNYKR